jgi:aryl-alcohol dehydrogenase-like predicted oxidoreductase
MRTVPLGASGLKVSEICLGALTFGMPKFGCDEAESQRIVDAFLDAGGNFFDTSDSYAAGRSEEILGRTLGRRRSDVVLATKFGHHTGPGVNERGSSRRHILAALEASLRRLGTDYVDLYQAHFYDDSTPIEETLDALADCVRAGKVRYIGCCNYYSWQLAEANKIAEHRRGAGVRLLPDHL